MKGILSALWVESLKVRRSRIFPITILAFAFMSIFMGLLIFIAKNPELVSKLGLIGTKAAFFGKETDWPAYLNLLMQVVSMIGLIGFGFVTSWIFGREYSDRTIKDILALPVSRYVIVFSKFIVTAIWCLLLSLVIFAVGLVTGWMIHIPGWSGELACQSFYTLIVTSILTILLCPTVAFFASYGRGYLPPIGFVIVTLITGQFINALGLAQYFPWTIPALYSGAAGADSSHLEIISYIILCFTGLAGLIGILAWWRFADQN
jgi:ABC-type transport system involved in multi-copper enzyme maturation permease subunit